MRTVIEYFRIKAFCATVTEQCFGFFCHFFRCFPTKNVKDEPPDTWDEEEPLPEGHEEREDKEIQIKKDKDLDFLFQDVRRNGSLDDRLKRDLQEKKSDPKYKEMLVSS